MLPQILEAQKKPPHIHPIVSFVTAQIKHKRFEEVEPVILEGQKLDRSNLHLNFITHKYYLAVGNVAEARKYYDLVFELLLKGSVDGVSENFIFNFCNSLLGEKRFEDVIALTEKYEQVNQQSVKTQFVRAKALSDTGAKYDAIEIYKNIYNELSKTQLLSERIHERYILLNIQTENYRSAYDLIKEYQIFYKKWPADLINLMARKNQSLSFEKLKQLLATFSFYDGLHSIHFNKNVHANTTKKNCH